MSSDGEHEDSSGSSSSEEESLSDAPSPATEPSNPLARAPDVAPVAPKIKQRQAVTIPEEAAHKQAQQPTGNAGSFVWKKAQEYLPRRFVEPDVIPPSPRSAGRSLSSPAPPRLDLSASRAPSSRRRHTARRRRASRRRSHRRHSPRRSRSADRHRSGAIDRSQYGFLSGESDEERDRSGSSSTDVRRSKKNGRRESGSPDPRAAQAAASSRSVARVRASAVEKHAEGDFDPIARCRNLHKTDGKSHHSSKALQLRAAENAHASRVRAFSPRRRAAHQANPFSAENFGYRELSRQLQEQEQRSRSGIDEEEPRGHAAPESGSALRAQSRSRSESSGARSPPRRPPTSAPSRASGHPTSRSPSGHFRSAKENTGSDHLASERAVSQNVDTHPSPPHSPPSPSSAQSRGQANASVFQSSSSYIKPFGVRRRPTARRKRKPGVERPASPGADSDENAFSFDHRVRSPPSRSPPARRRASEQSLPSLRRSPRLLAQKKLVAPADSVNSDRAMKMAPDSRLSHRNDKSLQSEEKS